MLRLSSTAPRSLVLLLLLVAGLSSCKREGQSKETPAAASTHAAPVPTAQTTGEDAKARSAKKARDLALTLPAFDKIQSVVNPKNLPPYAGAVGAVRGVLRITGDVAPELPLVLAKMEPKCIESRALFGKLFREGEGRTLADVLVAVTGYHGYVPITETDVKVFAKGCAFHARTLVMTYGQRLMIEGLDNRPYVPEILGQPLPAQLFVLPTSPQVPIAPHKPGQFKLIDSMRLYNVAELFVLPYRTFDVTEPDGVFEIKGIPVGPAKINALLPQINRVVEQDIVIEAGKTLELNLELSFDRAAWEKLPRATPLDELPAPKFEKPKED